jgi:hypothetical protein
MKSKTEIIRDFMGASIDAAREAIGIAKYAVRLQLEANEMLEDIVRYMGEKDAKAEKHSADIATLQRQLQEHERRLPPAAR